MRQSELMQNPGKLNTLDQSATALNQVMSRDQLLVFLAQRQLVAASQSPIGQFLGKDARLPAVADEVDGSDQLENALRVLIRPRNQLIQRVATPEGAFTSFFYSAGPLFRSPTYGCWRVDSENVQVSGPWSNLQIADEVGRHLQPSATIPPTGAVFPLSIDGLAVFCLVFDYVKTRYLQSQLDGKKLGEVELTFADLNALAGLARANSDLQHFRGCLQTLWPEIFMRPDSDIGHGIDELASSRLLRHNTSQGSWIATEILAEFVFDLFFHFPAISVTRQDIENPQPAPPRMLLIRGRRLWQIASDPEKIDTNRVFIRDVEPSIAFDDLLLFLGERAPDRPAQSPAGPSQSDDAPKRRPPRTSKKRAEERSQSMRSSNQSNAEDSKTENASKASAEKNHDELTNENSAFPDIFGSFFGSPDGGKPQQWNSPPEHPDSKSDGGR
ncbi:hypothetical protein KOR42_47600 [Thalassoglobus neptunius]|uniref:Uncharacterized protein n=1 Tax=Thalassoglobus neptunius TaxID=1938619 RepID=A0A5C5VV14_9PLAN|nr:hypothetical protein [Thalassoglobus neptunius]TWT41489.1 hypothetical protein KOR42_47600 [Thalassoglobus neptunius]